MRRVVLIVRALLILFVAVVVTTGTMLYQLDPEDYRAQLQDAASDALGRDVHLNGDIDLQLGLSPSLRLTDLVVDNPAGFPANIPFAQVDYAAVTLDLAHLVFDTVNVRRLDLSGVDVNLIVDDAGHRNWLIEPVHDRTADTDSDSGEIDHHGHSHWEAAANIPSLNDIVFSNFALTYREVDGAVTTFGVDRAQLQAASPTDDMAFSAQLSINEYPLHITLDLGSLEDLASGGPFEISGAVAAAGLAIDLDGLYRRAATTGRFTTAIRVDSDNPASLPELAIDTDVLIEDARVEFTNIVGSGAAEGMRGNLVVALGRDRPLIGGGIVIDRLTEIWTDGEFTADAGAAESESESELESGALIPTFDLPDPRGLPVDVDLGISIGEVVGTVVPVTDIGAELRLDAARLSLGIAQALVAGSRVVGTVELAGDDPSARQLLVSLNANDLSMAVIDPRMSGTASIAIELDGHGMTLRDAIASGVGRLEFVAGPANLAMPDVSHIGTSAASALAQVLPISGAGDVTAINCAVVRFDLVDGRLDSRGAIMDLPGVTVAGVGHIDLINEAIDIALRPEAREAAFVPQVAPVRLHGPLARPRMSLSFDSVSIADLLPGVAIPDADGPLQIRVPTVQEGAGPGGCVAAAETAQTPLGFIDAGNEAIDGIVDSIDTNDLTSPVLDGAEQLLSDPGGVVDQVQDGFSDPLNDLIGN